MFICCGRSFPTIYRVGSDALAVIGHALMGIDNEHFTEAVTFRARADRMVIGEEGGARTVNRYFTVAAVIRALEGMRLISLMRIVSSSGDGYS